MTDSAFAERVRPAPEKLGELVDAISQRALAKLPASSESGGRLLIVAGAVADGYRIYIAEGRVRETVGVVGGWAGAAATIAVYNSVTGTSNLTGPWAWAANVAGNLISATLGYIAGDEGATMLYDLTLIGDAVRVPSGVND